MQAAIENEMAEYLERRAGRSGPRQDNERSYVTVTIKGILEQLLHAKARIELGLEELPGGIDRPFIGNFSWIALQALNPSRAFSRLDPPGRLG